MASSSSSSSPFSSFQVLLILFIFFSISITIALADVPTFKSFRYVNQGEFGEYIVEYGASYRVLVGISPFSLAFYNTTPNAYYLGLRMGTTSSESLWRWVWEANRGNPVGEDATLTLGREGNLILAEADGKIVWSTGTTNRGVVGLQFLPNGNMVLVDKKGKFAWQSFDHPTDTLLAGQTLRSSGPTKLVSRASDVDGSEGAYSFVMEPTRVVMYMKNTPKPLPYHTGFTFNQGGLPLDSIKFAVAPDTDEGWAYQLTFEIELTNGSGPTVTGATDILARPKYNATLSMLRLGFDGNLKIYTFYDKVDWGAWGVTFDLFSDDGGWQAGVCALPSKCGSLGVCEDAQCVACPQPQGMMGWSKSCAPPELPPCKGGARMDYYRVVGVEHFLNKFVKGEGPMKVEKCKSKCSNDCKCVGFTYWEESSKCLLVTVLGTLMKVSNSSHVVYIKDAGGN